MVTGEDQYLYDLREIISYHLALLSAKVGEILVEMDHQIGGFGGSSIFSRII
jgi:hypothetical protein